MEAARSGSFSSTAREFGITQQLVSKHIKNIEDELGISLFFRGQTHTILTPQGRSLFDIFSDLSSDISWGQRIFSVSEKTVLHVAFCDFLGVIPSVQSVMNSFKDSGIVSDWNQVVLGSGDVLDSIENHTTDIAFLPDFLANHFGIQQSYYTTPPLFELPLYLVFPRRYVQSDTDERSPDFPLAFLYSGENKLYESCLAECIPSKTERHLFYTKSTRMPCQNWNSVMSNILCGNGYSITVSLIAETLNPSLFYCEPTSLSLPISAVWGNTCTKKDILGHLIHRLTDSGTAATITNPLDFV